MTINFLTNRVNDDFRQGLTKILNNCTPYHQHDQFIINIKECDEDLFEIEFLIAGCDFAVHTCYFFDKEMTIDYLAQNYGEFYCAFKLLKAFAKSNCNIAMFI